MQDRVTSNPVFTPSNWLPGDLAARVTQIKSLLEELAHLRAHGATQQLAHELQVLVGVSKLWNIRQTAFTSYEKKIEVTNIQAEGRVSFLRISKPLLYF